MKLFHQLTEEQQNAALNACVTKTVNELLSGVIEISSDSKEFEKQISHLIEDALLIPQSEREEFLIKHETGKEIIYDLAMEMAKTAFYHEKHELVLWVEEERKTDPSIEWN